MHRVINSLRYTIGNFSLTGGHTINTLAQTYCVEAALLCAINYTARKNVVRKNPAVIQNLRLSFEYNNLRCYLLLGYYMCYTSALQSLSRSY